MPRRLVVCADGTWNTKDQTDQGHVSPTNVVKLHEAVARRPSGTDGVAQLAYYHEGVGAAPNFLERTVAHAAGALHLRALEHNLLGGMTGEGLDANIKDCYHWLVEHYEPGDQLYFFGFSRGAYTARSLAGFIRNCGVLTAHNAGMIDKAFAFYRDRSPDTQPGAGEAAEFRRLYAREVDVTCIGVWDTVGALGIPLSLLEAENKTRYQFHDVTLSSHVKYAFHALAIDELRRPFAPTLWEQQPDAVAAGQVLEQTWFAGVHSNVGGGYADCGPSDTTFLWMAAGAARAGLELDDAYVKQAICHASWDGPLRDSFERIYEIEGRYPRPVAAGRSAKDDAAGTFDPRRERVHPTALQRFGKTVPSAARPYEPANLADYLRRFPAAAVGAPAH